jgi:hypothetical protein
MVHEVFAATELPQVLFCRKSPLFVPPTEMLETVSADPPVLLSVMFCGALVEFRGPLKFSCVGASEIAGRPSPLPLRLNVCGLPAALSAMAMLPVRAPADVGSKVMLRLQFAPGATATPQVLVCAKFPVAVMLAMVSGALPVFVSVIDDGGLTVSMTSSLKVTVFAENETSGVGGTLTVPPPLLAPPPPQEARRDNPRNKGSISLFSFILGFDSAASSIGGCRKTAVMTLRPNN